MFRAVTFAIAKYAQVVLQIFIVELADVAEKDQGEYWILNSSRSQLAEVRRKFSFSTPDSRARIMALFRSLSFSKRISFNSVALLSIKPYIGFQNVSICLGLYQILLNLNSLSNLKWP